MTTQPDYETLIQELNETHLSVIRDNPSSFTWGLVHKIHDIGPYAIVEYMDKAHKKFEFHVYIDGKDSNTGASSLDEALLLGIAIKNLGRNSGRPIGYGACRLLGVKTED